MSRYRGPKLRITRRLGDLPGLTQKKSKKTTRPGQHGKNLGEGKKKTTEYGIRLEEKQKLKFNYGISENQLYHYIYIYLAFHLSLNLKLLLLSSVVEE